MRLSRRRIEQAIFDHRSSMAEVSMKSGRPDRWLSQVLNGLSRRKPPIFDTIERLSEVLGVPERELLVFDEHEPLVWERRADYD